jgi:FMN phosphatase YigB (HAD superfamily)
MSIQDLTGRSIDCLLFDLGNTIWYRDNDALPSLEQDANLQALSILKRAGMPDTWQYLDDVQTSTLLRNAVFDTFHQHIAQHPGLEPAGWTVIRQILLPLTHKEYDQAIYEAIFEALGVRMLPSRLLFPDALSTLATLKQRGYTLGIVTNRYWGGQPLREDLEAMGLLHYFSLDHMIASADVHIRKPNADIFSMALKACSALPEQTVMIGDSLVADVAGAQQLGIFSVWKPFRYAEVTSTLSQSQNITISDYNTHQLHQLKATATITPPATVIFPRHENTWFTPFLQGHIQPQLIIDNLSELLDYF